MATAKHPDHKEAGRPPISKDFLEYSPNQTAQMLSLISARKIETDLAENLKILATSAQSAEHFKNIELITKDAFAKKLLLEAAKNNKQHNAFHLLMARCTSENYRFMLNLINAESYEFLIQENEHGQKPIDLIKNPKLQQALEIEASLAEAKYLGIPNIGNLETLMINNWERLTQRQQTQIRAASSAVAVGMLAYMTPGIGGLGAALTAGAFVYTIETMGLRNIFLKGFNQLQKSFTEFYRLPWQPLSSKTLAIGKILTIGLGAIVGFGLGAAMIAIPGIGPLLAPAVLPVGLVLSSLISAGVDKLINPIDKSIHKYEIPSLLKDILGAHKSKVLYDFLEEHIHRCETFLKKAQEIQDAVLMDFAQKDLERLEGFLTVLQNVSDPKDLQRDIDHWMKTIYHHHQNALKAFQTMILTNLEPNGLSTEPAAFNPPKTLLFHYVQSMMKDLINVKAAFQDLKAELTDRLNVSRLTK